ncbi:holin family protein [Fulvivirga ulvae]|uniref:3TM-type holin n=1 Tax=Fulvivirga ulvae TaxID=2904245 RepID=UPI001F31DC2C|nr:3TM-type holin [Fulvivirga ulvae]UII31352.1 holin family protein [Fulvivirga ulvae]
MSFLSKIFSGGAKEILAESGKLIDTIDSSDEEKSRAKNELSSIVFGALNGIQDAQQKIIVSETTGTWLQRSWRPLVMLCFTFIVVYAYFIQPAFLPGSVDVEAVIPEKFWNLLELGLGGYVIGRSVEKVAGTVTKNVDLPYLRKKDRKDVYG